MWGDFLCVSADSSNVTISVGGRDGHVLCSAKRSIKNIDLETKPRIKSKIRVEFVTITFHVASYKSFITKTLLMKKDNSERIMMKTE